MSIQLTDLNFNKVCRIRHILSEMETECSQIIRYFEGKIESVEIDVYASFFIRFANCLEATKTLLADFHKGKPYREHSIALLLRASLLDYLTMLYLETYYIEYRNNPKTECPNYKTELEKLLSSQIRRIISISELDKQGKHFNKHSFNEYIDKVYLKYNFLFEPSVKLDYNKPSNSLKYKNGNDEITNTKIRIRLDNVMRDSDINYVHVFSLYDIYSKYDHFGLISMSLKNMDTNEAFENMKNSLHYVLDGISRCMYILKNHYAIACNYNQIIKQIRELRGVFYTDYLVVSEDYKQKY